MNTAIEVFKNDEFGSIRTMTVDGEPMFVGKDVAEILGYVNPRKAILDHVDDDDKTDGVTIRDSIGRDQNPVMINESGLYSLILGSKLPTAKKFKHWVTAEVLPAIRKHGVYAMDDLLNDPDALITALTAYKEEKEKVAQLQEENLQKTQMISELSPKATYYDLILQSASLVPITSIAKDYGMSAKRLNSLLAENGIQFKQGKTWFLYQKYAEQGYTSSKTHAIDAEHSVMHTYWTQKGRLFLYDFLKGLGILPLIEQEAA
jgi:anti-repressor protein